MTWWTFGWLVWGLLFAYVEGRALWGRVRRDEPDTLSEHVWWLRNKHPFFKLFILVFMLGLTSHLVWGGN